MRSWKMSIRAKKRSGQWSMSNLFRKIQVFLTKTGRKNTRGKKYHIKHVSWMVIHRIMQKSISKLTVKTGLKNMACVSRKIHKIEIFR